MSEIPTYISRDRVCAEVSICSRTLDEWMARRGFPKPKRNGKWKWAEIEAYMDGAEAPAVRSPAHDQLKEIDDAYAATPARPH